MLKKYYEYYKKYYDLLYNEGAALKKLEETYGQEIKRVFPKLSFENLVQYDARLQDLRKEAEGMYKTKKHHNKYVLGALNEIVDAQTDRKYTTDKESMSDYSSKVGNDLKDMERQWNIYQQVLSATGDKSVAGMFSGLSGDANSKTGYFFNGSNGFVSDLSEYLENYIYNNITSPTRGNEFVDYDKVMNMDDKGIEKYAGAFFAPMDGINTGDTNRVEALATALKKWRDLVKDTEFAKGMSTYVELVKECVTGVNEASVAQQEYNDKVAQLSKLLETISNDPSSTTTLRQGLSGSSLRIIS